jgi:uncharacterized protein
MVVNALSKSPTDLTITPRDRRFGRGKAQERWWLGGDPIATAFYNALSITFPRGEAMFIEAVKAHRDGVPEKLDAEIRAFIQQEVMHSREHVSFNKRVVDAGYDTQKLEDDVTQTLAMIDGRPKILNLCVTMALEHYTAIMAKQMLEDPRVFAGADREQIDLWKWHAIEEIEHKGVAYDTWLHVTRDWSRWKRWKVKSIMMLLVTMRFWPRRTRGMLHLLKQDGLEGPRVWARIAWFYLGKPGVLRQLFRPWAAYFMPGFHPWNEDDRGLIQKAESEYEAARLPKALAA